MTNEAADVSKIPKTLDEKAEISEYFKQLRKWRENQLQNFRNKQLIECQSLLEQSDNNRKHLEKYFVNNKGVLPKNKTNEDVDNNSTKSESTLQESSLTGHFMRCFSDTSVDSVTFQNKDDNRIDATVPKGTIGSLKNILDGKDEVLEKYLKPDPGIAVPKKPKRPFLRKGTGLLRYIPKGDKDFNEVNKSTVPQRTVNFEAKSKRGRHGPPSRQRNCVQFNDPIVSYFGEGSNPKKQMPTISRSTVNSDVGRIETIQNATTETSLKCQDFENKTVNDDDSLSTENKELAEFEMLEDCAQNSSFNSDSSIVQRVIHGEPIKRSPSKRPNLQTYAEDSENENEKVSLKVTSLRAAKTNPGICLEEIQTQKQQIQDIISNTNPLITSLQKVISSSDNHSSETRFDEFSKKSNSPGDLTNDNGYQSDGESSHSSVDSIIFVPENETPVVIESSNSEVAGSTKVDHNQNYEISYEKESISNPANTEFPLSNPDTGKMTLRELRIELENEIKIYQERNAYVSKLTIDLNDVAKKQQKEFQKYKEAETEKLDEEKKQLKKQREAFNRYHKLKKDSLNRTEREELVAVRQQVGKLEGELKRQRIQLTNEHRKLKNQLIAAERERDSLRLENMALEEHCQELLTAIKARKPKRKSVEAQTNSDPEINIETNTDPEVNKKNLSNNGKTTNASGDKCSTQLSNAELNHTSTNSGSDANSVKPRVRFNLVPKCKNTTRKDSSKTPEKMTELETDKFTYSEAVLHETKKMEFTSKSSINIQENAAYKEVIQGNRVERVYSSGEREVILPSGTRKHFSADGKTIKVLFHNGDEKEIFPDETAVYRYANGIVEHHFPNGLEITKFPNGQIQKIHPDETKEIEFPDGSVQYNYPDGTEKIISVDGIVLMRHKDGTEIIKLKNGEKVTQTPTYKETVYLDGTVKITHSSGRRETRYTNGRIIIKGKNGRILLDTKHSNY